MIEEITSKSPPLEKTKANSEYSGGRVFLSLVWSAAMAWLVQWRVMTAFL